MLALLDIPKGSSGGGGAAVQNGDYLVFLLSALVALILLVAGFFVWLAFRERRNRRRYRSAADRLHARERWAAGRFQNPPFDSPCRWLAIRSGNPQSVQTALNLHNPTACSWEEGLAEARDRKLFISPPIDGWVLVVGSGLPDQADDADACFHFLTRLSRKLGHVQFFSLNRVVHHHAWARLDRGRVQRAYAWAGQTLWNQGPLTFVEAELGLRCFDYFEVNPRGDFSQSDPASVNTDKVPLLAARWSVDPAAIDERRLKPGRGIAGDLSSSRPS
ncbi:MAG: hypothetical protein HY300_00075 [Verrucomicrobia bacterium]|nr:hypothetical protein [Verrucomicrobiota bacterium]